MYIKFPNNCPVFKLIILISISRTRDLFGNSLYIVRMFLWNIKRKYFWNEKSDYKKYMSFTWLSSRLSPRTDWWSQKHFDVSGSLRHSDACRKRIIFSFRTPSSFFTFQQSLKMASSWICLKKYLKFWQQNFWQQFLTAKNEDGVYNTSNTHFWQIYFENHYLFWQKCNIQRNFFFVKNL